MTPEDANVDVLAEARQLLDEWCERRAYEAISILWGGLRSINGLTDGWEDFLKSLHTLRILAKGANSGISEVDAREIQRLIAVVGRALNSR